ncbi:MAG: hypothetical protein D6B27_01720 [Gammaproteobacteria bacterium]|nr:MAG: hypothetical protein D6B27_01720 [Gammaproteobacteria bacterium]
MSMSKIRLHAVNGIAALLVFSFCISSYAATDKYKYQRSLFNEARQAHQQGRLKEYKRLSSKLKSYPLYDYLVYGYLRNNFSRVSDKEVLSFIKNDKTGILAPPLRRNWVKSLGERKKWRAFLEHYSAKKDKSTVAKCYYADALISTGKKDEGLKIAKELWLVGKSQPGECDSVFSKLYKSGIITKSLVWLRIEKAMYKRNLKLTDYLITLLPKKDKKVLERWKEAYKNPYKTLSEVASWKQNSMTRKITAFAMIRLIRRNVVTAQKVYKKVSKKVKLSSYHKNLIKRRIAFSSALQHREGAAELIENLPKGQRSSFLKEWAVRSSMRDQDWKGVLTNLKKLTKKQQEENEWRYWKARALAETGDIKSARVIMKRLSVNRSYYGFMACDWLGIDYHMNHKPIAMNKKLIEKNLKRASVVRASELNKVGMKWWARRQLYVATKGIGKANRQAIAYIAQDWGWYDLAISIASYSGGLNDLNLRFPAAFTDEIKSAVAEKEIGMPWVMGVLRRESAFRSDAKSYVGAMGLMQVMPRTGRYVAKKANISLKNTSELLIPEKNIEIGSSYLSMMYKKFNSNKVLATAAYNAGPGNVNRWIPEDTSLPTDVWVDTIPFSETRKYTKAVLSFSAVFEWKLKGKATPLKINDLHIDVAELEPGEP